MSLYDDINFKSNYELEIKKLPTKEIQKEFKDEFVDTFNNVRTSDLKDMMYLDKNELTKFEFMLNGQLVVGPDFFKKMKVFDENMKENAKLDLMLDYLEHSYGIITPQSLKNIFEEIMGTGGIGLNDDDYENMIFYNFEKYQINLKDEKDKIKFKKFLEGTFEEERNDLNMLPSVTANNANRNSDVKKKENNNNSNKMVMI